MHSRITPAPFRRFTLAMLAAGALLAPAACGDDDPTGPVPFEKAAYLRSEAGGPPFSDVINEDAMDQAFGAGAWDDLRFETVDVTSLAANYTFLFLDGGELGADDMEAFITTNQTALQNFVSSGRGVLINSAPNEGDGMSLGFGVELLYGGTYASGEVEAVAPAHPIFAATGTTAFTGTSFGHAAVIGAGLTAIIQDANNPANVILAERSFGRGTALFGGMTTDNFHSPQPDAHELRINILSYAAGLLP